MPINKQPNKTSTQHVRQQNQAAAQSPGGYQSRNAQNAQTEFASETAAQAFRGAANAAQNATNAARNAANAAQTEFASETNAQAIRQKNAQSQAKKNQNQF
ncbi:gamma-type small acid-soluble spore protein [Paenactinomyces guangxiensis]|uniref:Small, acid-soluble spore protein gamma-type n=1 Tax=Paenactinomyces guangxiensis TaxID=1490290 RepID=A0A7W1WNA0_9BACL|nr:gamma-type small acid-soluble spore protein [Paenactinomyces guangxiensis]MBA4492941.1 gamma-type small acid-soluble spore protein [Paenactinomyces guangxiensis]MBH8590210.1 gamma-type small acid-soluble spore protein [Paenactinomyces guangxiensis]